MAGGNKSAAPTAAGGPGPSRWWQYLLIYPTLVVSVLTAAPQWLDKFQALANNVDSGGYREAKLQKDLYAKNLDCTTAPFDWYLNPNNVNLDATICESGDIYVRASSPNKPGSFYFVPVERVLGEEAPAVPKRVAAADAGERFAGVVTRAVMDGDPGAEDLLMQVQLPPRPLVREQMVVPTSVVCTKFMDSRRVLRHLRTTQACFDEVVDTLNGRTVSRTQVACRRSC
jgi:hypothetical protein